MSLGCVGACRGCVRNLGLSANQVLHIPGAGDFQIKQMQVLEQPAAHGTSRKEGPRDNADSASAMEVAAPQQHILPDMQLQEPLVRENEADDLIGEQTWPTDKVPLCFQPQIASRQLASELMADSLQVSGRTFLCLHVPGA